MVLKQRRKHKVELKRKQKPDELPYLRALLAHMMPLTELEKHPSLPATPELGQTVGTRLLTGTHM